MYQCLKFTFLCIQIKNSDRDQDNQPPSARIDEAALVCHGGGNAARGDRFGIDHSAIEAQAQKRLGLISPNAERACCDP